MYTSRSDPCRDASPGTSKRSAAWTPSSTTRASCTAQTSSVLMLWPRISSLRSSNARSGCLPQQRRRSRLGAHPHGRSGAPDDLRLGHLTQEWFATSDDPAALTSGGYWCHQTREKPHHATRDERFQNALLDHLAVVAGPAKPRSRPGPGTPACGKQLSELLEGSVY